MRDQPQEGGRDRSAQFQGAGITPFPAHPGSAAAPPRNSTHPPPVPLFVNPELSKAPPTAPVRPGGPPGQPPPPSGAPPAPGQGTPSARLGSEMGWCLPPPRAVCQVGNSPLFWI